MNKVFENLEKRGFMAQYTHKNEMLEHMKEPRAFYIGYDPTADSLTLGHFATLMLASHLQKAGHKPIILLGGGTAMIGDPTDKTGMRSIMTKETISNNAACFKKQMSKFLDFDSSNQNSAKLVNNYDWLFDINYIDFLREIGVHFSVKTMLSAECYKARLQNEEKGLTFFEFNYMLMQAYDFYYLYQKENCTLQFGGNDQWSNIIAGVHLIDRKLKKQTYGATVNLLTTSTGAKMGKTEKGAIWLDREKTSPFELFQYIRNINDEDVIPTMKRLTFIELEDIDTYEKLATKSINEVKEKLAFEIVNLIHSKKDAEEALSIAKSMFGGDKKANLPTFEVETNTTLIEAIKKAKFANTNSEARRLIEQRGIQLNGDVVEDFRYILQENDFKEDKKALLQKGKKNFVNLKLI